MDREAQRQVVALGAEGSPIQLKGVPLHKIDLRKLRHAAVLAFEGNLSRAAEKLHITPSALSQSISSLEGALGVVLFNRGSGGVTLTSVGQQFIGRIDKLLFDARGLARDLALAGKAAGGDAVFGIRPSPARIFVSQLIGELVRDCPELRIRIATTVNETLIEYLLLEGFEFVICDAPVNKIDERLAISHLASLPIRLFVRAGHPLEEAGGFTLADLRQFPVASVIETDENLRSVKTMLGFSNDEELPRSIWCDDYGFLLDAVHSSNAVLLAPAAAVTRELDRGEIVGVAPKDLAQPGTRELFLVTFANRNVSPAVAMILGRIKSILADRLQ
jgi:DNA-binding transcriptional LysR family regulator